MLKGVPETLRVLIALDVSEFDFYLTGSRYFGNVRPKSDWDFFVDDSQKVREFLGSEGFIEQPLWRSEYLDQNTSAVFRKNGVDIQLVKDIQMKHVAQEILKKSEATNVMHNKAQHSALWKIVYQCMSDMYGANL